MPRLTQHPTNIQGGVKKKLIISLDNCYNNIESVSWKENIKVRLTAAHFHTDFVFYEDIKDVYFRQL